MSPILKELKTCPQSFSNWRKAVELLSERQAKNILLSLVDYGFREIKATSIEDMIIRELKKMGVENEE